MEKYLGVKIIEAEPQKRYKGIDDERCLLKTPAEGYKVVYPDGYESWSPKEVFEKAYLKVQDNPTLPSGVSVGQKMVDDFIKEVHVSTLGEKTTLVRCTLVNGFEVVEASACVDKANYNEEIGAEICLSKIKDKIWMLLGFLLQTGVGGIK